MSKSPRKKGGRRKKVSKKKGGRKLVVAKPKTGRLDPAGLASLRKTLGKLQDENYRPKLNLPNLNVKPPKGAFVARPELTPNTIGAARGVFDALKPDVPVLLFPVRIETSYNDARTRLRIRIVPDQCSIDALDPRLTAEELAAGKAFLAEIRRAADQDAKRSAWHRFATTYAPRRAAHIVRTIREGGAGRTLREPGESHRALAPLLPDHWFVTGYAKSRVAFDRATKTVSGEIAFSPDLSVASDISNDVAIDPAVRWMVDYTEAVERGMAITVSLPTWAREQIDEIYVLGVRTSDPTARDGKLTPRAAANKLDALLASHLHDWGAGFVAPATATNNTSDVEAGWSDASVDLEDLFTRLIDERASEPAASNSALNPSPDEALTATGPLDAGGTPEAMNYARLEKMLGLESNASLKKFENRTGSEDAVQAAMNTLLWPVTWGEMLGPLLEGRGGTRLRKKTTDWLRKWFITSVRGGAALPTMRLGRTPYGVLPVTKTHLTREARLTEEEAKRQQLLGARLRGLLPYWEAAGDDVLRVGLSDSPIAKRFSDPGERFLQILRQQPNPAHYSLAEAVSERSLFDFRYGLRNLVVHPEYDSKVLQDVFADVEVQGSFKVGQKRIKYKTTAKAPGKAAYENWPGRFTSGAHQIEVLTEKRQQLLDILNPSSPLYDKIKVRLAGVEVNLSGSVAKAMKQRKRDITALADQLKALIDVCKDHIDANKGLDGVIGPLSTIYRGTVGPDSDDPHLSFLSFDPSLVGWDKQAHVVVRSGKKTVEFDTQADYLRKYADSFVSSASPPAEPEFQKGRKPLLFRLLKDAIYRTGVDEEPSSIPVFEMTEVAARVDVSPKDRQARIGDIIGTMEAREVTELTARIKSIGRLKRRARVPAKDERVARTLRGTSAKALTDLASTIDREVRRRKKETSFPAREMTALSAGLRAVGAAGDRALTGVTFSRAPNPRRTKINEMKKALALLRDLNPKQIELLMSQTMGLASSRLDAWLTSLPLRRIADLRNDRRRHGIQVGAYGWVQNLQPNRRDGDGNRVRSQGYVHTPSLNHARTAAVLRAGWTNYGSDDTDSPMAVNLTSDRMRDAEWVFAAVRQGQDLGDVLGYRFERYLKDKAKAPHWIYPIRQAVLSLTGRPFDPEQPGVDGLELNRIISTGKRSKLELKAREVLKELGGADKADTFKKAENALDYLSGQADALADAAIADSVHALVQGNLLRSGSGLSAISDGEVPPPELEALRTTPTAKTQTHRVALLAPLGSDAGDAWVSDPSLYPSSASDPDAEALVAALLGPPDQLRVTVTYCDAAGRVVAEHPLNWGEMLSAKSPFAAPALQTLMLLPADGLSADSALVQRVLTHASAFPPRGVPAGSAARFDRDSQDWTTLDALMDLWLGWRAVVLDARPMAPRDILIGEGDEGIALQLANLEQRAQSALQALKEQAATILEALPPPEEGDETPTGELPPEKLLATFDALVRLGVEEAVFRPATTVVDAETGYAHAWRLAPALRKKARAAAGITFDSKATTEVRVRTARRALRLVFGAKFPGLCRLTSSTLPVIAQSLSRSAARLRMTTGGTPAQWIEKLGYVRPSMRALNDAMLIQDCRPGSAGGVELQVAQWPEDDLQPWIAVDGATSESPPRSSLVAASVPGAARIGEEITGLIVDEVVDRVPAKVVNTGVALHYDAPNTEAPQTMLLALPPVGERWSYATMIDTVRDTFHLARTRAVDGHLLKDMHQFLPAIYAGKSLGSGSTS